MLVTESLRVFPYIIRYVEGHGFGRIGGNVKDEGRIMMDVRIVVVVSALGPEPKLEVPYFEGRHVDTTVGCWKRTTGKAVSPKEKDTIVRLLVHRCFRLVEENGRDILPIQCEFG
jgi:hypothetical protein